MNTVEPRRRFAGCMRASLCRGGLVVLLFAAAVCLVRPVVAQTSCGTCPIPGHNLPGTSGTVSCSTMWDPDGLGPLPPRLVVGGSFMAAGTAVASNIAVWDGQTFQALGPGLGLPSYDTVKCVVADSSGGLVAGGTFTVAGGTQVNGIARWDGSTWTSLGGGLFSGRGENQQVNAVVVLPDGDIVAAGLFSVPGSTPLKNIARWDGASWSPLGAGLKTAGASLALLPNGNIIAGLEYAGPPLSSAAVVRWDGAAWSAVGPNEQPPFESVTSLQVLADGSIAAAGTTPSTVVAVWDGVSWTALAGGPPIAVQTLRELPNHLLLAGGVTLQAQGTNFVPAIFAWDGASWSPYATGLAFTGGPPSFSSPAISTIEALADGQLIVGGIFDSASGQDTGGLAEWNGASWSPLNPQDPNAPGQVGVVASFPDGSLVVGGNCDAVYRSGAGGWTLLGSIDGGQVAGAQVSALTTMPNGDVVAYWTYPNNGPADLGALARWNGVSWVPFASGLVLYNGPLETIFSIPNGDLVASYPNVQIPGPMFSEQYVTRWTGSQWVPMVPSRASNFQSPNASAFVVLPNGDLVIGGRFTYIDDVFAQSVARWDGSKWNPLGAGLQGTVSALALAANGDLIAGGQFIAPGISPQANVARWDGAGWTALGDGVDGAVNALAVLSGGEIVAGGAFTHLKASLSPDDVPANGLAFWTGTGWSPIGTGVQIDGVPDYEQVKPGTVYALTPLPGGGFFAVGRFTAASGVVSPNWAEYAKPYAPPLATLANVKACRGGRAVLSSPVLDGSDATYAWQVSVPQSQQWMDLIDVAGQVSGSSTATLSISNVKLSISSGRYRCLVTTACGRSFTNAATVTVCAADFNCSGKVDVSDLFEFVAAWLKRDPRADVDGSGIVTISDLFTYLSLWFAGC